MHLTEINCKQLFQKAYEKRYTWDANFSGYKGKCIFLASNDKKYSGNFVLGKDLKPEIQGIDDKEIANKISSQLFEVSIHRVKRKFNEIHAKNNFKLIKDSESGIEMIVFGKNEGDKYRVKDNFINMVYRKIHETIIEIFVEEFLDTSCGFLSTKYTSQQIDPITLQMNPLKLAYEDKFIKVGQNQIWLLQSRSVKYQNQNNEIEIQKYLFENLTLLD